VAALLVHKDDNIDNKQDDDFQNQDWLSQSIKANVTEWKSMLKQATTQEGQNWAGQDYPEVQQDFKPKAALLMQREAQV